MLDKLNRQTTEKKLDRVIDLLETLVALELNKTNLNRNAIRARLRVDKVVVNRILNGIKKGE